MKDVRFSMLAEEFECMKERFHESKDPMVRSAVLREMRWLLREAEEARKGYLAEMARMYALGEARMVRANAWNRGRYN